MFSCSIFVQVETGELVNAESQYDVSTEPAVSASEVSEEPQLRDLIPFTAGERAFAVFANQVDGTAEGHAPAALPHAPRAVLGVVCVRGRMLTVLDPVALVTGEPSEWPQHLPCVVALRGDEQLALAAEECRDAITIAHSDIQTPAENTEGSASAVFGVVRYGGEEITILNMENLFASAGQRKERRRRRF